MSKTREKKPTPPQTITDDLFEQWKACTRRSDVKDMAVALEYSVPVINKALKHGHVNQPELVGAITRYFMARVAKENEDAERLKNMRGETAI
jgi:hypothetical protein